MFEWDEKKNVELSEKRKITFEEVVRAINSGALLDILNHPNQKKYPKQKLLIVEIDGYTWVAPMERKVNKLRLITAYPSRKYTKRYLGEER